jgi:hypothetical protein
VQGVSCLQYAMLSNDYSLILSMLQWADRRIKEKLKATPPSHTSAAASASASASTVAADGKAAAPSSGPEINGDLKGDGKSSSPGPGGSSSGIGKAAGGLKIMGVTPYDTALAASVLDVNIALPHAYPHYTGLTAHYAADKLGAANFQSQVRA